MDLVNRGITVKVILGKSIDKDIETSSLEKLKNLNVDYKKFNFKSSGLNPFTELLNFILLYKYLSKEKPDIVHSIALKPIILSGLSSLFLPKVKNIFAISGLGYIFTPRVQFSFKNFILKFFFYSLFKLILLNKKNFYIVQNKYDKKFVLDLKVNSNRIALIPGCGINLNLFKPIKYEDKQKIVLFPARLLKDKGLYDFVNAANYLKKNYADWTFIIAGSSNSDNPSSLTKKELNLLQKNKNIKLLGFVNNMIEIYKKTKIVCLPSYREGMPRAIQEAMACGCAIVTTDVPGCNESIINNYCGFLSKPKNPDDLASKLKILIDDDNLNKKFSNNSRDLASKRYSKNRILNLFYNFTLFVKKSNINNHFIITINNSKFYLNKNNLSEINSELDLNKNIVFIFGSSGYIGNTLINYLENKGDFQIIYISRNSNLIKMNNREALKMWKDNLQLLKNIFKKTHSIIYLISKNKYKNNKLDIKNLYFINNELLKAIYLCVVKNGVKNFIYASSIKVFGDENVNNKPFSINSKTNPSDHYAKSKLIAEKIIINNALSSTSYKILRFPMVYGDNIRRDFNKFFIFSLGLPVPLGKIYNQRSFVNVNNLNIYFEKALFSQTINNKILLLSDKETYSTSEIIKIILNNGMYKNKIIYINPKIIKFVSYILGVKKISDKLYQDFSMDITESINLLNDK